MIVVGLSLVFLGFAVLWFGELLTNGTWPIERLANPLRVWPRNFWFVVLAAAVAGGVRTVEQRAGRLRPVGAPDGVSAPESDCGDPQRAGSHMTFPSAGDRFSVRSRSLGSVGPTWGRLHVRRRDHRVADSVGDDGARIRAVRHRPLRRGSRVAPDEIELDYVLSLAETPTQADGGQIETDPEGYCTSLAGGFEFTLDGAEIALTGVSATTLREDGDGGLTTLRVVCNWVTPIAVSDDVRTVRFDDSNFSGRAGWREIIVIGDATEVTGQVRDDSLTARLTDYPDPSENPDTCSVTFEFVASADVDEATLPTTEPGEDDNDGLGLMRSRI